MKRVVIFGTGEAGHQAHVWFAAQHDVEIMGFADNDEKKQGTLFLNAQVYAPSRLAALGNIHIVITSMHYRDIRRQLIKDVGISPNQILYSLETYLLKTKDLCQKQDAEGIKVLAAEACTIYGSVAAQLVHAKYAESRKDWEQAVRLLEQVYQQEQFSNCGISPSTSLSLAQAYVYCREYARAEYLVEQSLALHPDHWALLKMHANIAMDQGSWRKAVTRWEMLMVERGRDRIPAGIHQALARACRGCGETKKEAQAVKCAVQSVCPPDELDLIVDRIQKALPAEQAWIKSTFSIQEEGRNFLGCMFHEFCKDGEYQRYFTKIVERARAGSEPAVYKYLLPRYLTLQQYTPKFVCHEKSSDDKVDFITLDWFEGRQCEREDIASILRVIPYILDIPRDEVVKFHINPEYARQQPIRMMTHLSIAILCSHLHEENSNSILFKMLEDCARISQLPAAILTNIEILGKIVLRDRLYEHIDPRTYSMFHGDLRKENILIGSDKTVCILDWSHVSSGFRGYDLALLFASFNLSWEEIRTLLKGHPKVLKYMSTIDYVLFLYLLLCFWILFLRPHHRGRQFQPPPTFVNDIHEIVACICRIHTEQEWQGSVDWHEI